LKGLQAYDGGLKSSRFKQDCGTGFQPVKSRKELAKDVAAMTVLSQLDD